MTAVIRSEFIKLRTVTAHWVLAIIAIAFPIVVTVLGAIFGEWSSFEPSRDIAGLVSGLTIVTAMLGGALTATNLTSEYGHNTIRPTFAATPSRARVHGGKLAVLSACAALLGFVATFGSWFLAQGILAARGTSISLGSETVLARLLSVVALAVLVTWFGYALGLLIRNAPATITLLLLWPLIIENLIAGLLSVSEVDGAVKWLPYSAAIAATVDDGFSDDTLGRPWGLVWFGVVAGMLLGLGLLLENRRDA